MAYYPIVTKSEPAIAFTDDRCLPTFYMEDFSVLGFRVDRCDEALRLLLTNNFEVQQTNHRCQVKIDSASQVGTILSLFADNDLECDICDVAEGIYQG